jgi:hypothetical protein
VEIKTHRKISNEFQQCCCIYSTSGWQSWLCDLIIEIHMQYTAGKSRHRAVSSMSLVLGELVELAFFCKQYDNYFILKPF